MLASSRSMPDYDAAARSFAAIGDERLAELETRCPAQVPMRKVAAFVPSQGARSWSGRGRGPDHKPWDRAATFHHDGNRAGAP